MTEWQRQNNIIEEVQMTKDDDPDLLTEDERFTEIAEMFARAVLRLRERNVLSNSEISLEAGEEDSLTGRAG